MNEHHKLITTPVEYESHFFIFFILNKAIFLIFKDRETFVEQTPRAIFSDNVSQWSIFDAYNEDFDQQVKENFIQKNKIKAFNSFSKKQKKKNRKRF